MMERTNCRIRMSPTNGFFPGTSDRILLASGSDYDAINACLTHVIHHLGHVVQKSGSDSILLKMVVPRSAVNEIMGEKSWRLQRLSRVSGCSVKISSRNDGTQLRLILFSGSAENVLRAARDVCQQLQQDSHLAEHMHFESDLELPLGVWEDDDNRPAEPDHPLIPPHDCRGLSKRELIEYLQQAAPRGLLLKQQLLGNMESSMKRNSMAALLAAVDETWRVRAEEAAGERVVETDV